MLLLNVARPSFGCDKRIQQHPLLILLHPDLLHLHPLFPLSSFGDASLIDILTQLQRVDARLDTLSMELYQVNVRVGCIARQ